MKKLPIGISTLEKMRKDDCVYIDKTRFVLQLSRGDYFFLSRPRRFGKSLFLDTLKQAFLGNKEIFRGLYLEENWDWSVKYPVIHLDIGEGVLTNRAELENALNGYLDVAYRHYQIISRYEQARQRFQDLNCAVIRKI